MLWIPEYSLNDDADDMAIRQSIFRAEMLIRKPI